MQSANRCDNDGASLDHHDRAQHIKIYDLAKVYAYLTQARILYTSIFIYFFTNHTK